MKYFGLFLLSICLVSCKTYSEDDLSKFDEEILEYLKEHHRACEKSPSGLYYNIMETGTGRAIKYRDVVTFKYTAELLDGTMVADGKEPVEFHVDQLIASWKEVIMELKLGGKAYLVAPPQLAYGTNELKNIPKNSILVFEMEVLEVK